MKAGRMKVHVTRVRFWGSSAIAIALVGGTGVARADQVIQVPLGQLLTARTVTTLTQGKLVPWTVGSRGGDRDGYMTAAASKFHNDPPTLKTLPDDGAFAADARHPQVVLHFSNDADPMSQQTFWIARSAGTFMFPVPVATYAKMFLFFSSGDAATALTITLGYGAGAQVVNVTVPDFFNSPAPSDPVLFNLASDLPNWYRTGAVYETGHHNICGIELQPVAGHREGPEFPAAPQEQAAVVASTHRPLVETDAASLASNGIDISAQSRLPWLLRLRLHAFGAGRTPEELQSVADTIDQLPTSKIPAILRRVHRALARLLSAMVGAGTWKCPLRLDVQSEPRETWRRLNKLRVIWALTGGDPCAERRRPTPRSARRVLAPPLLRGLHRCT